jgi:hypothetical protein
MVLLLWKNFLFLRNWNKGFPMKHIFLILFLVLSSTAAYAETELKTSIEFLAGGLTYHVIDSGSSSYNANKVSSDGRLISNPEFGIVLTQQFSYLYQSGAVFGGQNPVGQPMGGALYQFGYAIDNLQIGAAAGAYLQDDNAFRNAGVEPFRMFEVGSIGVVPVLGLALNYNIPLSEKTYLKINNVITPIITNSSLSFGVKL